VFPILGRDGALAGLAVLGPRLSEEPYSRDDRQLLVSVANQAGIALDSLRMAEEIAERMEAERRVAFELEVARGVQSRLLPQGAPRIETLECAGACIPARIVGGDYYDFIELGGGEVGLVLADIAGKGMAGALLMANLQASLRSQAGLAREDLPRLLRGVNRAMVESSADSRFATLFFGCYAADTRRMRYANCGHDPPILMRADGRVERLSATATVLGAFETWESTMVEICLAPGDTLVLYSDGIPEAMNERRAEFGEAGLLEALRRHRGLGVSELLSAILATVQEHSRGKPEDDVTLVVARCR
jgi:serine phosphatase RsbU (regulator of sigma subunit)